jgi:ppGpp synthetase/RelA/SpoT-type nucleotidyltranferase
MALKQPRPSFPEYLAWSKANIGTDWEDASLTRWYQINSQSGLAALDDHPAIAAIRQAVVEENKKFSDETNARLHLVDANVDDLLKLQAKPFASVVEKTYRLNILRNKQWPAAPRDGWIDQSNFFVRLNDVYRGQVVCSYVDGAVAAAHAANEALIAAGIAGAHMNPEGRDSGYYAYHLYSPVTLDFTGRDFRPAQYTVTVEIQFRTRLQSVLYELTHLIYEEHRLRADQPGPEWKWQLDSQEYRSSYLGHTLHLIEGVIVDLRRAIVERRAANTGLPDAQAGTREQQT